MPTLKKTALLLLGAVVCFHLANAGLGLAVLMVGFFYCLLCVVETDSFSELFWCGLVAGLLLYVPPLAFFWNIFGGLAVLLWMVLAAWLLAFLLLAWWWRRRYSRLALAIVAPILWTGLEYFRSELYPLRFSWLGAGSAFNGSEQIQWLGGMGIYGIGFLCMAAAAVLFLMRLELRLMAGALMLVASYIPWLSSSIPMAPEGNDVRMAGVQLESPTEPATLIALRELLVRHPAAKILVLSEYAFNGPMPASIKNFCRTHQVYLVAGGKAPAADGNYYDTAFVVGPTGEIVFSQAKSVPVQFMKDGLPATEQRVWYSPWGKIGIGICYDASYRHVMDELIQQGAQALIIPAMDEIGWGAQEHRLNALVAPMRAVEYQVPVFRLASSGISEAVDPLGTILAQADYPGQADMIAADIQLPLEGRLPLDHWLAPACTALTAGLLWWLAFTGTLKRFRRPPAPPPPAASKA